MTRHPGNGLLLLLALLGAAPAPVAAAPALQAEGRRIFTDGASPSGARIQARIGAGGMEISGATAACANCHGEDGRGRAEGGIAPPVIVWSELTKPGGHRHAGGRRHGPFDERSLRRALFEGVDPDGNRLDNAMPRYEMSERDFQSLLAYMQQLEQQRDAGVAADRLRIGTLLPATGRMVEAGVAVRDVLQAGFAAVNARGGVHGRQLELVVMPVAEGDSGDTLRARIAAQDVFALLAPLSAGVEGALAQAASEARIPVVGPLTLFPEDPRDSNLQVFHLLPGVPELALLLARHAAREGAAAARHAAVLHADTPASSVGARVLGQQLRDAGWHALTIARLRPGEAQATAAALKAQDVETVLVVGAGEAWPALARAAAAIGWQPLWLVPGPLASREAVDLPASIAARLVLAYPSAPADRRAAALRELAGLPGAVPQHHGMQVAAHAASQLLVEAIKRGGRDVSRRRLIATLEAVQSFETGLMPPLSFNADRRIGAWGGYLVGVDVASRSLKPLGGWERLP